MAIEKIQRDFEGNSHQIFFRVFLCLDYGRMNDTSTQNITARLHVYGRRNPLHKASRY